MISPHYFAQLKWGDEWFAYWLPYCFVKLRGPNTYLPLNRSYKPLGYVGHELVDYETFADTHGVVFDSDADSFTDIWVTTDSTRFYHLYDQTTRSLDDYFDRLRRLLDRSVKVVATTSGNE